MSSPTVRPDRDGADDRRAGGDHGACRSPGRGPGALGGATGGPGRAPRIGSASPPTGGRRRRRRSRGPGVGRHPCPDGGLGGTGGCGPGASPAVGRRRARRRGRGVCARAGGLSARYGDPPSPGTGPSHGGKRGHGGIAGGKAPRHAANATRRVRGRGAHPGQGRGSGPWDERHPVAACRDSRRGGSGADPRRSHSGGHGVRRPQSRFLPAVSGLDGEGGLAFLGEVTWDPYTFDDPSTLREVWRRLRVGVAMGQPF
jgi:hypothetical protein